MRMIVYRIATFTPNFDEEHLTTIGENSTIQAGAVIEDAHYD